MKKILVPVDFSGHTDITCEYALELSRAEGAEIRLFHSYFDQIVVADSSFPDALDMSTMYNEELLKEIFHNAERSMIDLKEKLEQEIRSRKIENTSVGFSVAYGEVEDELTEMYKEFHPDLIVVGATGMGKAINVWGKVSTFLIQNSMVPVLAVPEIKHFQGFGKIMMAADLTEENSQSIRKLLTLFEPFSATISCIHFLSKAKQGGEKEKMDRLREEFETEEKSGRITFEIRDVVDDNQKSIDQFIKERSIDLIAFQPYKHGILYRLFTKNITKKNLFATHVPLLAIPVQQGKL
jgi:nucleotide-binding universal stress UspA family protein